MFSLSLFSLLLSFSLSLIKKYNISVFKRKDIVEKMRLMTYNRNIIAQENVFEQVRGGGIESKYLRNGLLYTGTQTLENLKKVKDQIYVGGYTYSGRNVRDFTFNGFLFLNRRGRSKERAEEKNLFLGDE